MICSGAHLELGLRRSAHVNLPRLPFVVQEATIVDDACRELKIARVCIYANGLEATLALLVVIDALLCLGYGSVLYYVTVVMRGKDAVVARPLGGAGGCLVNHQEDRRVLCLAAPRSE